MSDCPCQQCISYAMCINKRRTGCSILWNYVSNGEESPYVAFKVVRQLLPYLEAVGDTTRKLAIHRRQPHFRIMI